MWVANRGADFGGWLGFARWSRRSYKESVDARLLHLRNFPVNRERPEVCDALLGLVRRLNPRNIIPGFGQKQSNYLLGLRVFSFAEVLEAEVVVGVEDVFGGPVAVVEVAPGGEVVVLDDEPV